MNHINATTTRGTVMLTGVYLVVSFLINLIFCFHASPLWHGYVGDQAMFSIIGENWAHGQLPYVSTWDSKGPIIFFVNMLGHLIASGENGIFILQILNIAGTLLIMHLYMRRWCGLRLELLCQLLFLLNYIIICSGGNQVGDSTQLLGTWAIMCAYDWTRRLEQKQYAHPWGSAVVYGMFTAACLLSRLTDSLVILTFTGIVAVILIWNGLWRNLMLNIASFVLGFAIVFVPFAVYFAWHGAFGEMWYATFSYNLEYAARSTSELQSTIKLAIHRVSYFFCLLLPLAVWCVSMIDRHRRYAATVWALAVLPALIWIFKSYTNANYAISFLPALVVVLLELAYHARVLHAAKWLFNLSAAFITVCCLYHAHIFRDFITVDEAAKQGVALTHDIPATEPLAAYNVDPTYFLYSHRLPCYRFFAVQDWAIINGRSLKPKVIECFSSGKAKWILVRAYKESDIKGLLEKKYKAYRRNAATDLTLFKRK